MRLCHDVAFLSQISHIFSGIVEFHTALLGVHRVLPRIKHRKFLSAKVVIDDPPNLLLHSSQLMLTSYLT